MQISNSTLQSISSTYVSPSQKEDESQKNEELENDKEKSNEPQKGRSELSLEEQEQVKELQARDTEVRAHEAAHQAAGGGMTGAASLSYQRGPDGKIYAIGGEVSISMKQGSTPEETIANARQIMAAAMAPANPSPQDYSVASSARVMEMKAQQQLVREQQEALMGQRSYKDSSTPTEDEQTPLINTPA